MDATLSRYSSNVKKHLYMPMPTTVPHYGTKDQEPTVVSAQKTKKSLRSAASSRASGSMVTFENSPLSCVSGSYAAPSTTSAAFSQSKSNGSKRSRRSNASRVSDILSLRDAILLSDVVKHVDQHSQMMSQCVSHAQKEVGEEILREREEFARYLEQERVVRSQLANKVSVYQQQVNDLMTQNSRQAENQSRDTRELKVEVISLRAQTASQQQIIDSQNETVQQLQEELKQLTSKHNAAVTSHANQVERMKTDNQNLINDCKRDAAAAVSKAQTEMEQLKAELAKPVKGRFMSSELHELSDQLRKEVAMRTALEATVKSLEAELKQARNLSFCVCCIHFVLLCISVHASHLC
jgi:chromosome segregation ATPase